MALGIPVVGCNEADQVGRVGDAIQVLQATGAH